MIKFAIGIPVVVAIGSFVLNAILAMLLALTYSTLTKESIVATMKFEKVPNQEMVYVGHLFSDTGSKLGDYKIYGDQWRVDASFIKMKYWANVLGVDSKYILDRLEVSTGFVPAIWPLEACNVLLVAERKKRIGEADSARFIALLAELPIIVEQEPPERMLKEIFAFAREHKLSSYGASYLDLAMRKGLPIATLDKNLMAAAKRSKVPLRNGNHPM